MSILHAAALPISLEIEAQSLELGPGRPLWPAVGDGNRFRVDAGFVPQVLAIGQGDRMNIQGKTEDDALPGPGGEPIADDPVHPAMGQVVVQGQEADMVHRRAETAADVGDLQLDQVGQFAFKSART